MHVTENLNPVERHSDTRLIRRAIREGWPVPAHLRRIIPEALGEVVKSLDTSTRHKLTAVYALLYADMQNILAERRT